MIQNRITKLKETALETGFYETGIVTTASLQFDPEIRKLCEENSCGNYGASWACPPAVGTLEECEQRCRQYDYMMIFSGRFEIEGSFDLDGMMNGLFRFKDMTEQFDRKLKNFLDFYQLLSNEGCGRCRSCTWPGAPCRFPEKLYHSIEGYGFRVDQLAKAAGMGYNNGENTVTYFGALLFRG